MAPQSLASDSLGPSAFDDLEFCTEGQFITLASRLPETWQPQPWDSPHCLAYWFADVQTPPPQSGKEQLAKVVSRVLLTVEMVLRHLALQGPHGAPDSALNSERIVSFWISMMLL